MNLSIRRYQTEGEQALVMRSRSGRPRLTTIEQDMAIIVARRVTWICRLEKLIIIF